MVKTDYENNKISIYNYRAKNKDLCNAISSKYYFKKRVYILYMKELLNAHLLY